MIVIAIVSGGKKIKQKFRLCALFARHLPSHSIRTEWEQWKLKSVLVVCALLLDENKFSLFAPDKSYHVRKVQTNRCPLKWNGRNARRDGCKYRITACREPSTKRQGHFGEFSRRNDWHWTLYRFRDYMNMNDDFIDTHKRREKKLMKGCGERDNVASNVNNNIFIHWMRINFAFCECQTMIPLNSPRECGAHWNAETRLLLEYLSCAFARLMCAPANSHAIAGCHQLASHSM